MWMGVKLVRLIASITSLLKSAFFSATMACVVQEVGRSDKLEEYEMLDRNDQGREEIQHDAEPPCMEETDASSYVLPVTLGQVIGDERNGKT